MESSWLQMLCTLAIRKKKIALVACVKEKSSSPCEVGKMYLSKDFQNWLTFARDWGADLIFVLSGKHGLLNLTDMIEPYDFNLNDQLSSYRVAWSDNVIRSLSMRCDLKEDEFLLLSNKIYAEFLIPHFGKVEMPLVIH